MDVRDKLRVCLILVILVTVIAGGFYYYSYYSGEFEGEPGRGTLITVVK